MPWAKHRFGPIFRWPAPWSPEPFSGLARAPGVPWTMPAPASQDLRRHPHRRSSATKGRRESAGSSCQGMSASCRFCPANRVRSWEVKQLQFGGMKRYPSVLKRCFATSMGLYQKWAWSTKRGKPLTIAPDVLSCQLNSPAAPCLFILFITRIWPKVYDTWVCLKIVYPYTQWLMIIIPTKWL